MDQTLTIFVNSWDSFNDCWNPFFNLMNKFWPGQNYEIILNTNKLNYNDYAVKSTCLNVESNNWGFATVSGLRQIKTDFVLYMQEDYFLNQNVNTDILQKALSIINSNENILTVGLSNHCNRKGDDFADSDFKIMSQGYRYRINLQAGLWRRKGLINLIRPDENPWKFEMMATKRANKSEDIVLNTNWEKFGINNAPISYCHTGIIKGKWNKEVFPLFTENNIKIDYNKRGVYKPQNWLKRKIQTLVTILRN